ncbi:MAG: SDR family oxidoreductase [Pseudomonadales bacterium]|jgi:NAD(P)-dependent dehydrogenase (short-subunit alcohol dehydrogenase family)|nr:SDR family oxidoreductase [Pseudomonadales bacterium]
MENKRILITGGNSGIGKVAAIELAKLGASMVLACKPGDKTQAALAEINAVARQPAINLPVDLASLESVRDLVGEFKQRYDSLDVLINNAGVFPARKKLTDDGFELQIGVNHLSHFLLTNLLLDVLKATPSARVVTVSSMLHKKGQIDFGSFRGEKKYNSQTAYAQSKLANVLFSVELARRLAVTDVTSNCLHPGGVRTDIMRDLPWLVRKLVDLMFITPQEGAKTTVKLASDSSLAEVTGKYFDQTRLESCSQLAEDEDLCGQLWQESEQLVELSAGAERS